MVYSLNYRRPPHVSANSPNRDSINGAVKQQSTDGSLESGNSGMSNGIPEALSFDRILAGGVCPVSVHPARHTYDHSHRLLNSNHSRAPLVTS